MLHITLRKHLQLNWLSLNLNPCDLCSKWVMWCSRLCDSLSALSSAIICSSMKCFSGYIFKVAQPLAPLTPIYVLLGVQAQFA